MRTSGNKDKKKKIVILTGPTSSGKTNLSIELARRYQTEIISADSMHVYKSFDIGTGKPSKNIMNTIPHHLIDIIRPDKDFDAWQYMKLSRDVINSSLNENLIVSGGTQLYIKSLLDGLTSELPKDDDFRKTLQDKLESNGIDHLYNMLLEIDPDQAKKINNRDIQRIIRFLEINKITQRKPSELFREENRTSLKDCQFIKIGLSISKPQLDDLINLRVDTMISDGLIDEVKSLVELYGEEIKPLRSIGYKEICMYLKGDFTKDESIEKIKTNTRRLAKRQTTWLRKDEEMVWFENVKALTEYSDKFVSN